MPADIAVALVAGINGRPVTAVATNPRWLDTFAALPGAVLEAADELKRCWAWGF